MTDHSQYRSLWLPDLLGIVFLAALATIPFLGPALDLGILSRFHQPGSPRPWPHEFDPLWRFLYTAGPWPALVTALTGLGLLVASLFRPGLIRWRRHAALVFLTMVLGPGFFVNTLFKDHWGRPRPREVTELGGTRASYQCFYERGTAGRGKSFPCGHSSMGYYFVVFYFLARRRHRGLALTALGSALAYGTLIGIARMAAGGHFASDVAWSAVFPCAVAWLLYYFILRIPQTEDTPRGTPPAAASRFRWLAWAAATILAILAIAAVLLGTPAHAELAYDLAVPGQEPALVKVQSDTIPVSTRVNPALEARITVTGEVRGFGWPWSRIRHQATWTREAGTSVLTVSVKILGHFSELDGQVVIQVPPGTAVNTLR